MPAETKTLPGLTRTQEDELRRRGLTRKKLEARLAKFGEDDPIIASLPAAARAELVYKPKTPVLLATAQALAEKLSEQLMWASSRVILVGSARREKPEIKDIDILLLRRPEGKSCVCRTTLETLKLRPGSTLKILTSYSSGSRRRSAIVRFNRANYRVDFFLADYEEKPYALFHHTGSKSYNIRVRAHAKAKGWLLNQYGLFDQKTGRKVRGTGAIRTEADLARFLGITVRSPENRQR